jgi:hypothetical protein
VNRSDHRACLNHDEDWDYEQGTNSDEEVNQRSNTDVPHAGPGRALAVTNKGQVEGRCALNHSLDVLVVNNRLAGIVGPVRVNPASGEIDRKDRHCARYDDTCDPEICIKEVRGWSFIATSHAPGDTTLSKERTEEQEPKETGQTCQRHRDFCLKPVMELGELVGVGVTRLNLCEDLERDQRKRTDLCEHREDSETSGDRNQQVMSERHCDDQ